MKESDICFIVSQMWFAASFVATGWQSGVCALIAIVLGAFQLFHAFRGE